MATAGSNPRSTGTNRTAGNKRPPAVTIITLNRKVNELTDQQRKHYDDFVARGASQQEALERLGVRLNDVTKLSERNAADSAAFRASLGATNRSVKLIDERTKRIERLLAQLGERVATDHDDIVAELNPRLVRLEELVNNGGMGMGLAAQIAGFDPDEVKEIISMQEVENLSDSAFLTGMIDTLRRHGVQITDMALHLKGLGETVLAHGRILGPDGQNFTDLRGRVDNLTTSVTESRTWVRRTIDGATVAKFYPAGAWIAAGITFALVFLITVLFGGDVTGPIFGVGAQAHTKIGQADIHPVYWLSGLGFGLLFGGLVLEAMSKLCLRTSDTDTSTTTTVSNHGTANATSPAAHPVPATQPTQPQPAVHHDAPQPVRS